MLAAVRPRSPLGETDWMPLFGSSGISGRLYATHLRVSGSALAAGDVEKRLPYKTRG